MSITKENLQKFSELWKTASESLSRKEFVEAFKAVTDLILRIQKEMVDKNNRSLVDFQSFVSDLAGKLESSNEVNLGGIKEKASKVMASVEKSLKEQENGMNFIYDKVRKIKEGKDGYTPRKGIDYFDGKNADEEKVIKNVLEKIVLPEVEPEKLRKKLESLQGEDRLDKDAIRGLQDEFKSLKEMIVANRNLGSAYRPRLRDMWIIETPSGTIDGANLTFTLSTNYIDNSLDIIADGVHMRITRDYTLSGRTLTMIVAPQLTLDAHYQKL